jgi:hypothetical protein
MKEPIIKVGFLLLIYALMEYVLQLRSAGSNPIGTAEDSMKEPIMKVGFSLLIYALMEYVIQLRSACSNPIGTACRKGRYRAHPAKENKKTTWQ